MVFGILNQTRDYAKSIISSRFLSNAQQIERIKQQKQKAAEAFEAIAKIIQSGWSETYACDMLHAYLEDSGVGFVSKKTEVIFGDNIAVSYTHLTLPTIYSV